MLWKAENFLPLLCVFFFSVASTKRFLPATKVREKSGNPVAFFSKAHTSYKTIPVRVSKKRRVSSRVFFCCFCRFRAPYMQRKGRLFAFSVHSNGLTRENTRLLHKYGIFLRSHPCRRNGLIYHRATCAAHKSCGKTTGCVPFTLHRTLFLTEIWFLLSFFPMLQTHLPLGVMQCDVFKHIFHFLKTHRSSLAHKAMGEEFQSTVFSRLNRKYISHSFIASFCRTSRPLIGGVNYGKHLLGLTEGDGGRFP